MISRSASLPLRIHNNYCHCHNAFDEFVGNNDPYQSFNNCCWYCWSHQTKHSVWISSKQPFGFFRRHISNHCRQSSHAPPRCTTFNKSRWSLCLFSFYWRNHFNHNKQQQQQQQQQRYRTNVIPWPWHSY